MILSYQDRTRTRIRATITTEHSASSYGQPVIVLPDGNILDAVSIILLDYRVEEATPEERFMLSAFSRNLCERTGLIFEPV